MQLFDPLSGILSRLKAESFLSTGLKAGNAWAVRFPSYSGLKHNAVARCCCWLAVDGDGRPIRLEAGDCFLLTKGRRFILASDLELDPIDAEVVFAGVAAGGIAQHGSVVDYFAIGSRIVLDEADAALLVDALPAVVQVSRVSEQADVMRWLLDRLPDEFAISQPGGAVMSAHLAHMMFVQALRTQAIHAMHGDPFRCWTLSELARNAGVSRSNFALRFKEQVGASPLDYLLRWRMRMAGQALRQSSDSVSSIALSLGYASESAFSNAFKRVKGRSPLRYRREFRSSKVTPP
jgi:AraC-like DNA-binding protein